MVLNTDHFAAIFLEKQRSFTADITETLYTDPGIF